MWRGQEALAVARLGRVAQSDGGGAPTGLRYNVSRAGVRTRPSRHRSEPTPPHAKRSLVSQENGAERVLSLRPAHLTGGAPGLPRPHWRSTWRGRPRPVPSALSRSPGRPGVLPAPEGGRAAAPGHADSAGHGGSSPGGRADPPRPGHGPPGPPPAWESLGRPAAERGGL